MSSLKIVTPKYRLNYRKIISDLDCSRGAPMGRFNVGKKPKYGTIYRYTIPLYEGYDRGGAYWGIGKLLYVEFNSKLTYIKFYRR